MNLTSEGHETNSIRLDIQWTINIDPNFVLIRKVDADICTFQTEGNFQWSPSWIYANAVVPGELFLGHWSEKI